MTIAKDILSRFNMDESVSSDWSNDEYIDFLYNAGYVPYVDNKELSSDQDPPKNKPFLMKASEPGYYDIVITLARNSKNSKGAVLDQSRSKIKTLYQGNLRDAINKATNDSLDEYDQEEYDMGDDRAVIINHLHDLISRSKKAIGVTSMDDFAEEGKNSFYFNVTISGNDYRIEVS